MTYEYICNACSHKWEAEQSISADPLKDCPSCGMAEAKRQISRGGGFILKGGGWYSDLYASPSKNPAAAESASDSTATKSASATETTITKPAAAPASTASAPTSAASSAASSD